MDNVMTGGSVTGWLFAIGTVVLFAWGLWIAYLGMRADMPAFREGGHAPGAKGTFDPHFHTAA